MILRRFLLAAVLILSTWAVAPAAEEIREQGLGFSAPQFEVEELAAELVNDGEAIYVAGKIRNRSQAPVRGYVVVYFRNGENQPLHAVEVDVNDRKTFAHNEAGAFEATASISGISGIAKVSVEFVDQPTPVQSSARK